MTCDNAKMLPMRDRIGQGKNCAFVLERLEPRRLFAATSPAGTGLSATYFNNADFTGANVTRVDRKVYFDFAAAPPPAPIAPTTFSVRWTGQVKPSFHETYTFAVTADDG